MHTLDTDQLLTSMIKHCKRYGRPWFEVATEVDKLSAHPGRGIHVDSRIRNLRILPFGEGTIGSDYLLYFFKESKKIVLLIEIGDFGSITECTKLADPEMFAKVKKKVAEIEALMLMPE